MFDQLVSPMSLRALEFVCLPLSRNLTLQLTKATIVWQLYDDYIARIA